MNTDTIPAGLWLSLWADQQQQDRFTDGIREYIRMYYKEFTGATEVEAPVVDMLEKMFDTVTISGTSVEEIIREVEEDINSNGGIYDEWERKSHKVATYGPEED